MRFQQIFVTINILMDHTASGALIPRIDSASNIRNTEIASPDFKSTVVLAPSDEHLYQQQKAVDQLKAQATKDFGSPSVTMKHRKLQQVEHPPPTPCGTHMYPGLPDGQKFDPDPPNYSNLMVFGGLAAFCAIGTVILCLCRNKRIPISEAPGKHENKPGGGGGKF